MQEAIGKKGVFNLLENKPRFLYVLCILINAVLGCYVLENVAFFNEESFILNNNFEFYIVFVACILSNISLLFFVSKYEKQRLNVFPFIICQICLISNCVGIFSLSSSSLVSMQVSESKTVSFNFEIDIFTKIRYCLLFCLSIYYAYMIFGVYPKLIKSSSSFSFIFFGIAFVTIFSIVWSLIFEWDVYVKYFSNEDSLMASDIVASCYNNRNTFGTLLLLGICSLGYLQSRRHNIIHYLLMIVFYIELYFVVSKTSIILSTLFLLVYLIYRFILTIKPHPIKTILASILLIGLYTLFICFGALKVFGENSIFSKLFDNFIQAFDFSEMPSVESRNFIWKGLISFMNENPTRIIFGIGEYIPNFLLAGAFSKYEGGYFYAHNGLLQVFASGGIIRLICLLSFYICFLFKAIKNLCNKKRISFVFILIFIVFSLHGLTESTYFYPSDTKGFALCFVTFLPVFCDYERLKDTSNEEIEPIRKTKVKYFHSPLSKTSLLLSLILPLFTFFAGIYFNLTSSLSSSFNYYFYLICLISPLFLFWCFYFCFSINKNRNVLYVLLSLLLILGGDVACFFLNEPISFSIFLILYFLLTFSLLFRAKKYLQNENKKRTWLLFIGLFIYIGLSMLLNYLPTIFADFKASYSLSYLAGLIVANLFLYQCYILFPKEKSLVAPLDLKLYFASLRLSYFLEKIEAKRNLKEDKYFKRNQYFKQRFN